MAIPCNDIISASPKNALLFSLTEHPLQPSLARLLDCDLGSFASRQFPDGESYLCLESDVAGRDCIVIADLCHPDAKYLPLLFLLDTLRELGASSVGLVAPYLSYMRQDRRFIDGEAVTSRIFAQDLSRHIDWLVTVDPHLHRYHSLDEIYQVPSAVVQGAPALAAWLKSQKDVLLVGPDAESEQWVSSIAAESGHAFVIGTKQRHGDRDVEVSLPSLDSYHTHTAVIIDDVISSGQTILECIKTLKARGITRIRCCAVHGIFADGSDAELLAAGLESLVTTNTIAHPSNRIDIATLLVEPIRTLLCTASKEEEPV